MELKLELKAVGENGLFIVRSQIDDFVAENFSTLFEGAVRLGLSIDEDYYAPKRVQIGRTRLHERIGLKYADGHKYSDEAAPTEKQLRQTIEDIQSLIDAAAQVIPAPFELQIIKK